MSSPYKITLPRNEYEGKEIARLNISVGQEYHEGDKFSSLCEWVSRHFNHCVVNVCDSLQRHNFEAMDIQPEQAHQMALANGDLWIQRNKSVIDTLPNVSIIRWDDWRKGAYWDYAIDRVNRLEKTEKEFRDICNEVVDSFVAKKTFQSDPERFKASVYSRRYIMEEVAFVLVSSFDDVADVYPGTFLPVFDYMRDNGLPAPVSMTSISFKRRKQKPRVA